MQSILVTEPCCRGVPILACLLIAHIAGYTGCPTGVELDNALSQELGRRAAAAELPEPEVLMTAGRFLTEPVIVGSAAPDDVDFETPPSSSP